jgi:endonuclease/exonuclease/phosphatase family metal-dependent hydrolase
MSMEIKLGSLNLCLGLANKKDLVKQIILDEKIDIMCVQETELSSNLDHSLLSFPGYIYESEKSNIKARVGLFIRSGLKYVRRLDLEEVDCHVMIVDISSKNDLRIINLYRSFSPQNNYSPSEFFIRQIHLIKRAITKNTVLIGDFNLDWSKKGQPGYAFSSYFDEMDHLLEESSMIQLVDFPTWSRTVSGYLRESKIDHIYSNDPTSLSPVGSIKPCFGDHLALVFHYNIERVPNKPTYRRNWKHYNNVCLLLMLAEINWDITDDMVQGFWNSFENKLIGVVDSLIPMSYESNNVN